MNKNTGRQKTGGVFMFQELKCFVVFLLWWLMVISLKILPFIISKPGKARTKDKDKPFKPVLTKWELLLLVTMLIVVCVSPETLIDAYIAAKQTATMIP